METPPGPVAMETPPATSSLPGAGREGGGGGGAPKGRRRGRHALLALIGEVGSEAERQALRGTLERGKPARARAEPVQHPGERSGLDRVAQQQQEPRQPWTPFPGPCLASEGAPWTPPSPERLPPQSPAAAGREARLLARQPRGEAEVLRWGAAPSRPAALGFWGLVRSDLGLPASACARTATCRLPAAGIQEASRRRISSVPPGLAGAGPQAEGAACRGSAGRRRERSPPLQNGQEILQTSPPSCRLKQSLTCQDGRMLLNLALAGKAKQNGRTLDSSRKTRSGA